MSRATRLLLVAPDQSHLDAVAADLRERAGTTVLRAEGVTDALDTLDTESVDCILTASTLPEGDGLGLLEKVRARPEAVPVVLLVASGSEQTAMDALNAGADGYYRQDDDIETVLSGVEQAVDERETRREHREASTVLDSLFEEFPEHMHLYLKDEDGRHVRVTDTFEEQQREGWVGKADYEITGVHPSESETYQDDRHVIDEAQAVTGKIERSDVSEHWLRTSKMPWYDDGEVVGLVGITEDITEQTERKRRLQRLTDRFELALEATGAGVIDWNLETSAINLHGSAGTLLGLDDDRETLELPTLLERIHPEDRPRVSRLVDSLCASGQSFEIDFRLQRDDGWRWVECHGKLYRDDETETRAVGILNDTTERKRRERHREQHQQRITSLHSVAIDLQHCDSDTEICERTIEAAKEILSFDQCVITLQDGDILPIEASSEGISVEDLEPMSVDEGLTGKTFQTGEPYLVADVQSHPEATPRGEYGGLLSVPVGDHGVFQAVSNEVDTFDAEDLELAELLITHTATALNRLGREQTLEQQTAELKRQNDRLDRFASIVSHDLRNPLQVAQGHLELSGIDDDHLQTVSEMHERMETLLTELLALAREGDRVTDTEAIDLGEATQMCWASVETPDATLDVADAPTIRGDPQSVRQLFENLFRNAVDHSISAVTVRVGTLSDGFFVADDGPGIPPDIREDIFEAGFSTAEDGTGYGLNIVEQIVSGHGWEISVTDSQDGGARFEITDVVTEST